MQCHVGLYFLSNSYRGNNNRIIKDTKVHDHFTLKRTPTQHVKQMYIKAVVAADAAILFLHAEWCFP